MFSTLHSPVLPTGSLARPPHPRPSCRVSPAHCPRTPLPCPTPGLAEGLSEPLCPARNLPDPEPTPPSPRATRSCQPTAQRPQPLPVWPTGLKTLWVLGGVAGSPQVPTEVDTALLSGEWSHHLGPSSDPGRGRAGTGHPACTSIGLWTPGARTPVPAQPRGVLSDHSASPGSQKSQVSPGPCTCRRREPRPPRPPLSKHPDRMSLLIPGEPAATCLQGRLLGSRVRASALTSWKCQRQAWPDPASTLCNSKASWEVTPQEGGSHHGHCARTAPRQGLRRPPVQTPPAFHARGRVVNRCSERGNFLMDQQPSKKKTGGTLKSC